jgi:YHS domain-containing protein
MIATSERRRQACLGVALAAVFLCTSLRRHAVRAAEPDPIAWREDYGSALEEARAANRLLWIQFTGPWCPNCTRMERESLPDPAVVQHARESFVPLKLRSDVHEQLALTFNLSALPATIIVAPNRDVVAMHQGYLGPAEFDAFLRESLARLPGKPARETASGSPAPPRLETNEPKTDSRLAIKGYCTVSLIRDRKLVPGRSEYTIEHEGLSYRFASPSLKDLFHEHPELYVPANQGACPVTQLDHGKTQPGLPNWGILFQSRLFLFASDQARKRFVEEPQRYAMADVAEGGFCTHCIRDSGLLVRGDPRHEISRDGRRYWFPDVSHRDAFLATKR